MYANPLNEAIMQMIPELTHTMANFNISQAPTWGEGPLRGFVTGTLSAAYQASWNSMVERFNSTSATTKVQLPSPVLRARVNSKRVCVWIVLHLLTLVAAALLVILQRCCVNEAVVDLVAACLLTDPTDILRTPEGSQICTLGAIPGESSRKIGDIMIREKVSDDRSVHRRVLWRKEKVVEEKMSMLGSGEPHEAAI